MTPDFAVYILGVAVGAICGYTAGWHYERGNYGWAGMLFMLGLLNIGHAVVP